MLDVDVKLDRLFKVTHILNRRNPLDLIAIDQRGNFFNDRVTRLLKRDLGDNNAMPVFSVLFDSTACPDHNGTATRVIPLTNRSSSTDNSARGEVGTGKDLHDFVDRRLGSVNQ